MNDNILIEELNQTMACEITEQFCNRQENLYELDKLDNIFNYLGMPKVFSELMSA